MAAERHIAAAEFFLGRFTIPLADDELITELVFPVTEGRPAYTKFCHRLFDWALAGAAAQPTRHGWRVGLVNVSDTPVRVRGVEQALDAGAATWRRPSWRPKAWPPRRPSVHLRSTNST